MLTYLVNLKVHRASEKAWKRYMLEKHISDVLNSGLFIEADLAFIEKSFPEDKSYDSSWVYYRASYKLENQEKLDLYMKKFAPALQAEHKELFGTTVVADCEILSS